MAIPAWNVSSYTIPYKKNGYYGFKDWECYMLVKYGDSNFGSGGQNEYLLELPLYPEQVTESIQSNWDTQEVLGRSSPLAAYSSTSLKTASFELSLHRDFLAGSYSLTTDDLSVIVDEDANRSGLNGYTAKNKQNTNSLVGKALEREAAGTQVTQAGGIFGTRSWYVNANKMLQISCYPQYTSSGLRPPITYFVFGQMILKGFVTSYSTTWKGPILNTFYGWNTVQITMSCFPDGIISADQIITNKSFNGIDGAASTQNTYNTKFPSNIGSSSVMNRTETTNRNNARGSSLGSNIFDTFS